MNLRTIDLNLLPVFEAIYVERSLTRASEALNVTQPAVSNALARLRDHFGDPLFVRSGAGVAPTSAAEALINPIRDALMRLRSGLDQAARFDPSGSSRAFSVAARDAATFLLAPRIWRRLSECAPGVRINWRQVERADVVMGLASRRLDLAIDVPGLRGRDLASVPLLSDRYVCVLRVGHPALRRKMDVASFLALRHVVVSSRPAGRSIVDEALRASGQRLTPVMRFSHYLPALALVSASDCVLVAPYSIAKAYDLAKRELPFNAPALDLHLYWRAEANEDAAIGWLRQELSACAGPERAAK